MNHGVTVLATGAKAYKPQEYLYGEHGAVVTHLDMDELFRKDDLRIKGPVKWFSSSASVPETRRIPIVQNYAAPIRSKVHWN